MITLGVVTGVLIIVFYGLAIFCGIRRKKQQPKEEKIIKYKKTFKRLKIFFFNLELIRMIYSLLKLTDVALTNVKRSARFSSCFIAILMLIITVLALITKWLLLKPIHNELVDKYKQEEPVFYQRQSFCNLIDLEDMNMLTFPIACFLLIIFIIFSKRTSCGKQNLHSYIGPVIAVDFYVHIKRKFAAVIFAIIAEELLDIINQVLNGESSEGGLNL